MTQQYGTLSQLGVPPNGLAKDLRLSEGKWSLSSLSNVPYITITGLGYSKTFSWGELIDIPKNVMGQVVNASKHKGDIYINSGWDYANVPARITVPVPLVLRGAAGEFITYPLPPALPTFPAFATTMFPVDTRRARKAFLVMGLNTPVGGEGYEGQEFIIVGQPNTTSMNTYNSVVDLTAPFIPGNGYYSRYTLPPLTQGVIIPLGFEAGKGCCSLPHALLDFAQVYWPLLREEDYPQSDAGAIGSSPYRPAAFYMLEY